MGEDGTCHLSIDHVTRACTPSHSFITLRCVQLAFTIVSSSLTSPVCLLWFFCPDDGGRMQNTTSVNIVSSSLALLLWKPPLVAITPFFYSHPLLLPSTIIHVVHYHLSIPVIASHLHSPSLTVGHASTPWKAEDKTSLAPK
jgi:hypothetical protein